MGEINDFVTINKSKNKWKVVGFQPPLPTIEVGDLLLLRSSKSQTK